MIKDVLGHHDGGGAVHSLAAVPARALATGSQGRRPAAVARAAPPTRCRLGVTLRPFKFVCRISVRALPAADSETSSRRRHGLCYP